MAKLWAKSHKGKERHSVVGHGINAKDGMECESLPLPAACVHTHSTLLQSWCITDNNVTLNTYFTTAESIPGTRASLNNLQKVNLQYCDSINKFLVFAVAENKPNQNMYRYAYG